MQSHRIQGATEPTQPNGIQASPGIPRHPQAPGWVGVPPVDPTAPCPPAGDGTASRPYSSLQRAIRAANQRDRIYIVSGSVLLGDGNRELKHLGKDILIWTTPGTTVTIDCEDMVRTCPVGYPCTAWHEHWAGTLFMGQCGPVVSCWISRHTHPNPALMSPQGLAVLAEDQQARWSQIYPQSSVSEGTRGEIQSSADVRYRRCKRSPTITLPE